MPPDPPIPAGTTGVLHRDQQVRASTPLTLEELWKYTMQNQRGFLSSPGSKDDNFRSTPATLPKGGLQGPGAPVGKGYETFATVQVITKDGQQVALATDFFGGGGEDNHGEARAVRGLEHSGPARAEGGRMVVLTEKDPCSSCEQRLTNYARSRGIGEVEVYIPDRPSMTNPNVGVSGKTASRTSFQAGRPPVTIKRLRTIKVPGGGGGKLPGGGGVSEEAPAISARTAVVGTLLHIGAGVALHIFQQEFREKMLKDLENMPKPKVDRQEAGAYFTDPKTASGIRLLDLFNKNLDTFTKELQDHHLSIVTRTNAEIMLLALSRLSDPAKVAFLDGIGDQLTIYWDQLLMVRDNLEAAKALEAKSLEAAKAAEDLANLVDRALVADWLLKQGFSFDDILTIYENLTSYSSRVRRVFQDINAALKQVETCVSEEAALASQVNKLRWSIVFSGIREELKRRGVEGVE